MGREGRDRFRKRREEEEHVGQRPWRSMMSWFHAPKLIFKERSI